MLASALLVLSLVLAAGTPAWAAPTVWEGRWAVNGNHSVKGAYTGTLTVSRVSGNNYTVTGQLQYSDGKKEDFVLIKAGESLPKRFDVHFWTGDTVAPGVYTLSMAYQVWENWYFDDEQGARVDVNAWTGTLHSNEVKIEVH